MAAQINNNNQNTNYKYPMQPIIIPIGVKSVEYHQPTITQPKIVNPISPQVATTPIVQPITKNPQFGNNIVNAPIGQKVPLSNPNSTTLTITPLPPPLVGPPPPQPFTPPFTIIIRRVYENDGCCNFL